jgi:DNA-binding MarR family transcriptional regulator
MDPATAGRQVRILDDDGLVASATSDEDGRVTMVGLTDRGRDVYRDIVEVRTEFVGQVLADWSRTDRADLVRLVDRLVADLGAVEFRPGTSTQRRSGRPRGVDQ